MKNKFVRYMITLGLVAVMVFGVVPISTILQARPLTTEQGHSIHFDRYVLPDFALYIAFTSHLPLTDERMDEIRYIVAKNMDALKVAGVEFWTVWLPEGDTIPFTTYPLREVSLSRPAFAVQSEQVVSQETETVAVAGAKADVNCNNDTFTPEWITSDRLLISSVGELTTDALNAYGTMQGMFTNDELLTMIEQAPTRQDTRSVVTSPTCRSFTDEELAYWIDEYHAMGGLNDFELGVLRAINEIRAYHGLHPVAISIEMSMSARLHSQEMADLRFFAHRSPNNGTPTNRGAMFGANVWAENISGGGFRETSTVEQTMASWLRSPGHRAALLNSGITVVGIGTTLGGGTTFKFGCSVELPAIHRRTDMECITIRNPYTLGFCFFEGWVGEALIEARI